MSSELTNREQTFPRLRKGCSPSPMEVRDAVQLALKRLSALGYRQTALLLTVLKEMASHHSPVTLSGLMSLPGIGACDPSSVYRLVKRLESEGIVTKLGLGHKAPHYILNMPGHQHSYLICKLCGVLEETCEQAPVSTECVDCHFAPWTKVKSELWFTGICPNCN